MKQHPVRRLSLFGLAADKAMDAGADVYRPDDVHRWLEHLARNGWAERPAPAQRIR